MIGTILTIHSSVSRGLTMRDYLNQEIQSIFKESHFDRLYRKLTIYHNKSTKIVQNLFDETLSREDVYTLLKLKNANGSTFGMYVASYEDAPTTQQYLILLETLLDKGLPAIDIIELLKLQTNYESNFGMFLASSQDASVTQQYFDLIQTLLNQQTADDIYNLLKLKNKADDSFGRLMWKHQSKNSCPQNLIFQTGYELLQLGYEFTPLLDFKVQILNYIFTLGNQQKDILISALDKKTLLGRFFWHPRLFGASLTRGSLEKICIRLSLLVPKLEFDEILRRIDNKPEKQIFVLFPTPARIEKSINGGNLSIDFDNKTPDDWLDSNDNADVLDYKH